MQLLLTVHHGRESSRIAAFVGCELSPVSRWAVWCCNCFWVIPAPVSDFTHTPASKPIQLLLCLSMVPFLEWICLSVASLQERSLTQHMCEYIHAWSHIDAYVYMHTYKNTSIYTYIYTQVHINMSDCATHAHIYSHTCRCTHVYLFKMSFQTVTQSILYRSWQTDSFLPRKQKGRGYT